MNGLKFFKIVLSLEAKNFFVITYVRAKNKYRRSICDKSAWHRVILLSVVVGKFQRHTMSVQRHVMYNEARWGGLNLNKLTTGLSSNKYIFLNFNLLIRLRRCIRLASFGQVYTTVFGFLGVIVFQKKIFINKIVLLMSFFVLA